MAATLPLMIALITAPAMLATNEAIRQGQSKDRKEEHRSKRCNLIVRSVTPSNRSVEVNSRRIVLRNSKLYVESNESGQHPYEGYFLPYPDQTFEGLVSSIPTASSGGPPVMNWIYVDRSTYEVKYGVRVDAQPNFTGPFDATRQDHRLSFDGWEGFVVVEEEDENGEKCWALYFDLDDDGMGQKLGASRIVLEVVLSRAEKRAEKARD